MINNLVYILIFSPLLMAFFIRLSIANEIFLKSVSASAFLLFLIIAAMLAIEVREIGSISSDLSFTISSLGLEFYINSISIFFIFIFLFLKINQIFQIDFKAMDFVNIESFKSYLSLQFIIIFAIFGIIFSSYIFNSLIFVEIYILATLAINMLNDDEKMKEFYILFLKVNLALTMLLLLIFVFIYINSGKESLIDLSKHLSEYSIEHQILIFAIFFIYIFKLFAFWLFNIKNIKNLPALLSQLYLVIFINTNLALFLLIKYYDIITIYNYFSVFIGVLAMAIVAYCCFRLLFAKQIRIQVSMICAAISAIATTALVFKNQDSITSFFFYIFLLNTVVLMIFNIFFYASTNFNILNINEFAAIRTGQGVFLRIVSYLFIFGLVLLLPLPHSTTFFANYFFTSAIFENNDIQLYEYTNLLDPYYLIMILVFQLVMMYFCYRYAMQLLHASKSAAMPKKYSSSPDFWFLFVNILLVLLIIFVYFDLELFKFFINQTSVIFLT